ncbi:MAG: pyridoxal phosphate-dependent aminotransferase [Rhizobiaceae bacterium]
MPRYTPLVESLPATVPFVGPETQERARAAKFTARLGANESVFGPSPHAIEAMRRAVSEAWQYSDPENHDLKAALAAHHGVKPINIVVGEGIDGLLGYLARMLVGEGTPVVTSDGAYPTFNFHVAGYGGRLVKVPYKDDHEDADALLEAAKREDASLIYFANPDNPMGTWIDAEALNWFISSVPEQTVLCLDEAYCDFAPGGTVPEIDVSRPNIIRMRTFSKGYGMAGARIGYAIAHEELAVAFNKVRNHFGVNRIAQIGALAALADQAYLEEVKLLVADAKARIADIARANGFNPIPSATNFVTMDCGRDGNFARALVRSLGGEGIFVRMPFVVPGDRCIRVSAGKPDDLDAFETAVPRANENVMRAE